MTDLKRTIKLMLPEKLKVILRPLYHMLRKIFGRKQSSPSIDEHPVGHQLLESAPVGDRLSTLAIGIFGGFEVAYRRNTADEAVICHSFDDDIFFTGVPEYQPEEGDVIIDMGAHIGTFSLLASEKVGNGTVFSIEASEESFNLLRINVALNKCDNISVHHLAMSDKEGTCVLYHDTIDGNWGHSTVKQLSEFTETVVSGTLEGFLERNNIKECHFMKLNVEGAEFPVLLNTPCDILKRFGTLLVLYHCDLWGSNSETDLIAHLESSGFECHLRNKTEMRGWIIAVNANFGK